jgi:hypothetical protein
VAAGTVGVNRRSWTTRPEQGVDFEAFVAEVHAEVARKGLPEDRAPGSPGGPIVAGPS